MKSGVFMRVALCVCVFAKNACFGSKGYPACILGISTRQVQSSVFTPHPLIFHLDAFKAAPIVDFQKGKRSSTCLPPGLDPATYTQRPADL